jgi:hypothetical protein
MSGTFVTNIPTAPVKNDAQPKGGISAIAMCGAPKLSYTENELFAKFPDGVATDTLAADDSGRVPTTAVRSYVESLESRGILPKRPTQDVAGDIESEMTMLTNNDTAVYARLQDEYCWYEQRYKYALRKFFELATSRQTGDNRAAREMLNDTKMLNRRLNSVLEVMNFMAIDRVRYVNFNKDDINTRNRSIQDSLSKMKNDYGYLTKTNVVVQTQKEMVRYTQEKNNHSANQMALWLALNALALTTIFFVYRN